MTTTILGNLAVLDDGVNGLAGLCGVRPMCWHRSFEYYRQEPDWTQWATRLELDVQARFTDNLLYMKCVVTRQSAHDFSEKLRSLRQ